MVKPWAEACEKAIKITRYRIAHHEKHGNGAVAEEEKRILKKQLRNKELRAAKK